VTKFLYFTAALRQENTVEYFDIDHCTIDQAFTRVSSKLLDLLEGRVTVGRIRFACFVNANTTLGIGYPEGLQQKMIAATSVTQLFEVLALHPTHWSWINIQVMEKIASVNDQATILVDYYKAVMSGKKIKEVSQSIPNFKIDMSFYSKIKDKWDMPLDDITLKDIQEHQSHVGEIFGVNKTALVLVDIVTGCVEIHWLIPKVLINHVDVEYQKNIKRMGEFNIKMLLFEFLPSPLTALPGKLQLLYNAQKCMQVDGSI